MKLGDIIYSYKALNGMFEYICIEIREQIDNIQYVLECQQCDHGYKCKILVIKSRIKGEYEYIETLNDGFENDEQYFWHKCDRYFIDIKKCREAKAIETIQFYKDKIENAEKTIKHSNEQIKEIECWSNSGIWSKLKKDDVKIS